MDLVFIAELHIFSLPGLQPGTPPFRCLNTTITTRTKVLASANKRLTPRRGITANDIRFSVSIRDTTITAAYLPGKDSISDLQNTLDSLPITAKTCILGDFNGHHEDWNNRFSDKRSQTIANLAELGDFDNTFP